MTGVSPPRSVTVGTAIVALLFLLVAAPPLAARRLRLQIRNDRDSTAIGGAIVRLMADGRIVAQALTAESGRVTWSPRRRQL